MKGKYVQIVRIERIQNERCYMQYLAHLVDFNKRLNMDTERRLYHGCPQDAANSIINDGFNRRFAGVNGKFCLFSFADLSIIYAYIHLQELSLALVFIFHRTQLIATATLLPILITNDTCFLLVFLLERQLKGICQ